MAFIGKIAEAGSGVAVGIGLKMAFNAAAIGVGATTGLGIAAVAVVALGYGVTKTVYDKYSEDRKIFKLRSRRALLGRALSDNWNMDFAKTSLKNSAFFGIGATVGFVGPEEIMEKITPIIDKATPYIAPYTEGISKLLASTPSITNWIPDIKFPDISWADFKPDIFASSEDNFDTSTYIIKDGFSDLLSNSPDLVSDIVKPPSAMEQLSWLADSNELDKMELINEALTGDSQALKDVAFNLLNERDGFESNPELGAQLMQEAANMGNAQAIKDVEYLKSIGLIETLTMGQEINLLQGLSSAAQSIVDAMEAGDPQAKNDVAVGLLSGTLGFPQDFDLGLKLLEEGVENGHEKSIHDMQTLIEKEIINPLDLKMETQMKLQLSGGADAVCSRTLAGENLKDACQFSSSVTPDDRSSIYKAFDAARQAVDNAKGFFSGDLFTFRNAIPSEKIALH